MKYDYLIVGSGLYGATFAYCAGLRGKKCLVIEKRDHIGGNIYCQNISGINVHKYGAHIFHTSNEEVWKFVNAILPFNRFTNSPLANVKGKIYNLPFNMNTFYQLWGVTTPQQARDKIDEQIASFKKAMLLQGITEPRNLEEQALTLVGHDIYETFIKYYTEKQWGRKCTELPAFIIKRLPVRFVYDNNYFQDKFQGIPIGGYTLLVEKMLEKADVELNANFFDNREYWESLAKNIVFTGRIDEFFNYKFGKLEYRSVYFENEVLNTSNYQGNAVVNYTDAETPYTRVIEHKHFEMFGSAVDEIPQTVISREFPVECYENIEPYYPINDKRNTDLYLKYAELLSSQQNVIFGGRLAEYKYYDMAPIVEKVLAYWNSQEQQ